MKNSKEQKTDKPSTQTSSLHSNVPKSPGLQKLERMQPIFIREFRERIKSGWTPPV